MNPQKLPPKEFNETREGLRAYCLGASKHVIAWITGLFAHIAWQAHRIKILEAENFAIKQPQMAFLCDNPPAPYVSSASIPKPDKIPLRERLKLLDQSSDDWKRCLKFNRLTEEQALELIKKNV